MWLQAPLSRLQPGRQAPIPRRWLQARDVPIHKGDGTAPVVARHRCRLLMHPTACPFCLALASAGSSNAARMAMIAMTTSSSIKVKAAAARQPLVPCVLRNSQAVRPGRPAADAQDLFMLNVRQAAQPMKGIDFQAKPLADAIHTVALRPTSASRTLRQVRDIVPWPIPGTGSAATKVGIITRIG